MLRDADDAATTSTQLACYQPGGRYRRHADALSDDDARQRDALRGKPLLTRNRRITAVRRRGKYLLLDTEPAGSLLVHLGMSGRRLLAGPRRFSVARRRATRRHRR